MNLEEQSTVDLETLVKTVLPVLLDCLERRVMVVLMVVLETLVKTDYLDDLEMSDQVAFLVLKETVEPLVPPANPAPPEPPEQREMLD